MLRQPILLLRLVGLSVCAVTASFAIGDSANRTNIFHAVAELFRLPWLPAILDLCGFFCFGWAFWILTRPKDFFVPSKRKFTLMGLQAALALALQAPELLYLVSTELGFLLPTPLGFELAAFSALSEVWTYYLHPDAQRWLFPAFIDQLSLKMLAVLMIALTYHLLSFCFGLFGAVENRQRRELAAMQETQAESARLSERLAIARELHDSLGHSLTGLTVNLQLASRMAEGKAAQYVGEAYLLSRVLLNDVRAVVTNLRDIEAVELSSALAGMASRVSSPKVNVEVDKDFGAVEQVVSHALFRCAQEFVTNTIRHAGARNIFLRLNRTPTHYELSARDDGNGAVALQAGNGLTGICERIEELGGSVDIETAPNLGFAMLVKVPRLRDGTE